MRQARVIPRPAARRALLATGLLACIAGANSAMAQGVRATIDRTEATIKDRLTLSIVVDGSQTAQPQLPDLPDFSVYSRGQQSQFNMANGRTSVSITHNYILVPKKTGTFTIGAATAEIDGEVYRSQPFRVKILEATETPRESNALFITSRVSNDNPYIGQQVIYTWRFYRRVRTGDAQLITPFEFEGFLVEDLGEVREFRTTRGGQEYLVSEIRKALFPQEQGELTIPQSQLACQVAVRDRRSRRDDLFGSLFGRTQTEQRTLSAPAVKVNVRPLPAAPAGYSGLVGDFSIKSRISKRDLQVGESATWKLTVAGTGNVQMIGEPPLSGLESFKTYDDKPTSSINRTGNELTGSRSFSKALVPLESGQLTLRPVELSYFDPEAGSYKTARTSPVTLEVRPAEGKEELRLTESVAPTTGKVAVRILADDILPIYKDLDAVAAAPFGHRINAGWLAGLAGPPLLFFGLLFVERRRHHLETNVHLVRRRSALKKALKGLADVEQGGPTEASQRASLVLREYIGDKTNLEGGALTPVEAEEELRRCGVEDDVVSATRRHLESFEAAQFGGGGTSDGASLAAELKPLLQQLERQIRR